MRTEGATCFPSYPRSSAKSAVCFPENPSRLATIFNACSTRVGSTLLAVLGGVIDDGNESRIIRHVDFAVSGERENGYCKTSRFIRHFARIFVLVVN
jgi:hypothetical protein